VKYGGRRRRRIVFERVCIIIITLLLVTAVGRLASRASSVRTSGTQAYPGLYAGEIPVQREAPAKTVYLTFDDGPSKNTEAILDILRERGAKATFFVTAQGDDLDFIMSVYRRIVQEGHSIGLHSYTHQTGSIYRSTDAFLADIDKLNTLVMEATGVRPTIFRFPGGSNTSNCTKSVMRELKAELERRGYIYYDWHVSTGDDTRTVYPADTLAKTILKGVRGRSSAVVLCHDNPTPKTTPEAVAVVIDTLMDEGYRFERLTPDIIPIQFK